MTRGGSEAPLLGDGRREGGGSSAEGGSKARDDVAEALKRGLPLGRRVAALGLGNNYEKAAALVDKAMDGEGLPAGVLEGLKEGGSRAHLSYFLSTLFEPVWNLNLLLLFLLNFVEVPLWCKETFPSPCGDEEHFGLSRIPFISRKLSFGLELLTFTVVVLQTFWPLSYMKRKAFFALGFDLARVVLCALLSVDLVFYALYVFNFQRGPVVNLPFRAAPYLRILIIILSSTNLRRIVVIFFASFVNFLDIGVFLALYVLFWSWLAYLLFEDTPQGAAFSSYGATLYRMHALLQTQDSPDEWLPAFKSGLPQTLTPNPNPSPSLKLQRKRELDETLIERWQYRE